MNDVESYQQDFLDWDVKDIEALKKDNKIKPFSRVGLSNQHYLMKRGIISCQRGYEDIKDAIENNAPLLKEKDLAGYEKKKKRFAVLTGLKLRRPIHFGHKCIIDQIVWYQQMGGDVFIVLSDIESWFFDDDKRITIKDSAKNAIDYILTFLALGIDIKNCQIYSQWERKEMVLLALSFSKDIKCDEYNDNSNTIGKKLYPAIVASDIAHIQLKKYGGDRPIIVPVGKDQYSKLNIAISIIEKDGHFRIPAVTYNKPLPGPDGDVMSDKNAILLTDKPEDVYFKLIEARTSPGKPNLCTLFEMLYFNCEDDEKVEDVDDKCRKEYENNCYECKKNIAQYFRNWVKEFQEKKKELEKDDKKIRFILNQEIPRETEMLNDITPG